MNDRQELQTHLAITRALRDSMDESVRSDPNNVWKHAGYKSFARRHNETVLAVSSLVGRDIPLKMFEVDTMPGPADMPAIGQKSIYESVRLEVSVVIAYLENLIGVKDDEVEDLANFIQAKLRSAVFREPDDERQVQDCLEQLFIGRGLTRGLDYDRETGRLKVSSKEFVPDFIFARLGLAIEVKLVRPSRTASLIDQINADIAAYLQGYARLVFVLYDLAAIRDESEFKRGLEAKEKVRLVIVKH